MKQLKEIAEGKKILKCRIERENCQNYEYAVFDDKKRVAVGTSSSLEWVVHDAGGYHTKGEFDQLYPQGWAVEFDFSPHQGRILNQ